MWASATLRFLLLQLELFTSARSGKTCFSFFLSFCTAGNDLGPCTCFASALPSQAPAWAQALSVEGARWVEWS